MSAEDKEKFAFGIDKHMYINPEGDHLHEISIYSNDPGETEEILKAYEDRYDGIAIPIEKNEVRGGQRASFGFTGNWRGSNWEPTGPNQQNWGYVSKDSDKTVN